MNPIQPSQTRPIQDAWEALSNAFRVYGETRFSARRLLEVDTEEAVTNIDLAFEQKLEKFHTFYDLTKKLPGFEYFGNADTSLILTLRNAVHHRHHALFVSWNRRLFLDGGLKKKAGAAYLIGSAHRFENEQIARFMYPLQDFYRRLETGEQVKTPEKLRNMWNADLRFAELAELGEKERYPPEQVYIDVVPPLVSAMRRVVAWLEEVEFKAHGFDGQTFLTHFKSVEGTDVCMFTKELRIPVWA